jgi:hypothetical protein
MAVLTIVSFAVGFPVAAAGTMGVVVLAICNSNPKFSVVAFLLAICLAPYWWGVVLGGYVPLAAVVALAVIPGALMRGIKGSQHTVVAVLLLGAFVAVLVIAGASIAGHGFVVLAQWIPAFFVGYALTQQVGLDFVRDAVTVIFAGVAVFTIVEYFANWNPYFGTAPNTEQYEKLGTLQRRGGVTRTEWSFGQSIALANSLALAIPMTLTSRFRSWTRVLVFVLIIIAISTTFSRSGLLSAALASILTFWASRGEVSRGMRAGIPAIIVATAAVTLPWVDRVFGAASTEAARSAAYREDLLDMIPYLNAFGTATGYHEVDGVFEWFGLISIDNTFLRLAVNFGWVFGGICLAVAVWVFFRAAARRASIPAIALASIVPALLTVALITQFAILVWFYIGVAAAVASTRPPTADTPTRAARSNVPNTYLQRGER